MENIRTKMENIIEEVEAGGSDPFIQELMSRCRGRLFKDTQNRKFVVMDKDGTDKVYIIESEAFKHFLVSTYYTLSEGKIDLGFMKRITELFKSLAYENGRTVDLQLRCTWDNNILYYDLHDEEQNIIKITSDGWEITKPNKPMFKSYTHMMPQISPSEGGSLESFIDLFNLAPEDRMLMKVYVVSLFIPGFPHPILKIEGEKGSAKSTASKLLKMLVDPSKIKIFSFPDKNRELVQQLDHHYFVGYDNISKITKDVSDALCRAVSGDGYSSRTLYTSDEDTIRSFKRMITINGLNMGPLSDDLLDRCLLINFKRIDEAHRKTDDEIFSDFNRMLPGVLGNIFSIVSKAIQYYPEVNLDKIFRLADFTKWGYAIGKALDQEDGGDQFYRDFKRMIDRQETVSIEDNVLLNAFCIFLDRHEYWRGTPASLYNGLEVIVRQMRLDKTDVSWPKSANHMSRWLKAYTSLFDSKGYVIQTNYRTASNRLIIIHKKEHNLSMIDKKVPSMSFKEFGVRVNTK